MFGEQFLLIGRSLRLDTGLAPAADRTLDDESKPALHLGEPRGIGGTIKESWPLLQPSLHFDVLVRAVVVDDQVQIERLACLLVDLSQEAEELLVPMP